MTTLRMLQDVIRKSGETQVQWAARLGISKGYMSKLISGERRPTLDLAIRIEDATDGAVPARSWVAIDPLAPEAAQ